MLTDGASNLGVGAVDELKGPHEEAQADIFYRQLGEHAKAQNTSISLIAISGSDAKLERIGLAAECSNGSINVTKPLELVREIRSIYQNPVAATQVRVRAVVHPAFRFVDLQAGASVNSDTTASLVARKGLLALFGRKQEDAGSDETAAASVWEREVGQVCQEQDLGLAFELNPAWKGNLKSLARVPFQIQAFFRSPDGSVKVRVSSSMLDVSMDRAMCEAGIIASVVALAAVQQCAALAARGEQTVALERFASVSSLLLRAGRSDEQQEESYIFKEETKPLCAAMVRRCSTTKSSKSSKTPSVGGDDDAAVAAFASMRKAPLRQFQSAARKNVQQRMVAVDQQERVANFGVEAAFEVA